MQKLFLFVSCTCLVTIGTVQSISDIETIFQNGNYRFTAQIFSEVVKKNAGKNIVVSAFSVLTPLTQLSLASEGPSHDELLNAVGFYNDSIAIAVFAVINQKVRTMKGVELKIANKLYIPMGYQIQDEFVKVSRFVFHSSIANVNFADKINTAKEINAWVEIQTNHRIKNFIQPDSLTDETRGLFVNALYFKGKWKYPFDTDRTRTESFHVNRQQTIEIPMMHNKKTYSYGESDKLGAKLLELPYIGDELSFLVVLPNDIEGIDGLLEKLKDPFILNTKIRDIMSNVNDIEVSIPKFKIETTTDLKEVLVNMKITKIFGNEANLKKMNTNGTLYITDVIQKAFIDINEEGDEAAAANTINDTRMIAFLADHPFVYVLRENDDTIFNGVFYGS